MGIIYGQVSGAGNASTSSTSEGGQVQLLRRKAAGLDEHVELGPDEFIAGVSFEQEVVSTFQGPFPTTQVAHQPI